VRGKEYTRLARLGRWDEYARRLADEGLAWWFEMDVPTIQARMAPLLARRSAGLSPRLRLLEGSFATLPMDADPGATLRDVTILYRLFQASRDAEGTAAACCLAVAAVWDFGTEFSRTRPWLRRMTRLIASPKISPLARSALQAFVALVYIFHEGRLKEAIEILGQQRREAEAARSAAMMLYGATLEALAHAYGGDTERALLVLEDAAPFREKAPPTSHTRLYVEIIRGVVLNAAGRPAEAYRVLLDCERIFPRGLMRVSMSLLLIGNRLMAASLAGHRDEARLLEANVRNLAVAEHVHFYTGLMHFSIGVAYLRGGRPYKALLHAEQGGRAGDRAESFVAVELNRVLRALALVDLNETEEAVERLREIAEGSAVRGFFLFRDAAVLEQASLALNAGDPSAALRLLETERPPPSRGKIVSVFRPPEYSANLHERLGATCSRIAVWAAPGQGERSIEIRCLGEFSMRISGRTVFDRRWGSGRTQQLLKLLLAFGGEEVTTAELIDRLWGDVDADRAYASLKTALSRLRRAGSREGAGPVRWIRWANGRISLTPSVVAVDAFAFESRAERLRREGSGGDWRETAALYLGDFLPGEDAFGLVDRRRNRLRDLHVFVVEGCLREIDETGDREGALECLSHAISVNPTSEKLYHVKISRLIESGFRMEALKTYREAEAVFHDRFGTGPGPEFRTLADRIGKGAKK